MSRVRLRRRVMDQIQNEIGRANGQAVGGLLIGGPEEGGWWIERVLVCRNAAEDQVGDYQVDAAVLENVGRTLARTSHGILGVFFGGGQAERVGGIGPDGLIWKVDPANAAGAEPVNTAGVLRLEVLEEPNHRALICPE